MWGWGWGGRHTAGGPPPLVRRSAGRGGVLGRRPGGVTLAASGGSSSARARAAAAAAADAAARAAAPRGSRSRRRAAAAAAAALSFDVPGRVRRRRRGLDGERPRGARRGAAAACSSPRRGRRARRDHKPAAGQVLPHRRRVVGGHVHAGRQAHAGREPAGNDNKLLRPAGHRRPRRASAAEAPRRRSPRQMVEAKLKEAEDNIRRNGGDA